MSDIKANCNFESISRMAPRKSSIGVPLAPFDLACGLLMTGHRGAKPSALGKRPGLSLSKAARRRAHSCPCLRYQIPL
jgi:hypothetical protein